MPLVAPSILAADFLKLGEECSMVNQSEADWFHLDVMDGRFVPNISFGIPVIEQISKIATKPCDVHLMVARPESLLEAFKRAGADHIIVHLETCPNLHSTLEQIVSLDMKPAVALNPHSGVSQLRDILNLVHHVCVMSVDPGFGGQQFIPHTLTKIRELKELILKTGSDCLIEIDGGVTLHNAKQIVEAGADVLVAGNTVFNSSDPMDTIHQLKRAG